MANTNTIRENGSSITLIQDVDAGATELTMEIPGADFLKGNLRAGDILLFFECPEYEWSRVSAVNGNRILLEKPLKRGYLSASRIEVMRVSE
ncbi:MAG: hypothetical protein R3C61_15290 [Bacteroidia bacterium]